MSRILTVIIFVPLFNTAVIDAPSKKFELLICFWLIILFQNLSRLAVLKDDSNVIPSIVFKTYISPNAEEW